MSRLVHNHWRRSALNSAGALQGGGGELRAIYTLFYTIKFRGGPKSGGARAPDAPASSAPMYIYIPYVPGYNIIFSFIGYVRLLDND